MKLQQSKFKPALAMLAVASALAACGGSSSDSILGSNGGAGGTSSNTQAGTNPVPSSISAPLSMSCPDGTGYQCSGSTIIRVDNGIGLTNSGVQVYARSTSDLADNIAVKTTASGFSLASGGVAEARVAKDGSGNVTGQALLLSNLGLSWDGKSERPQIIDTFQTSAGRTTLDGNGALVFGALPTSSDLGFYDYATRGAGATQANYANNRYFPRAGNPSRCPADVVPCPAVETNGVQSRPGDWRSGGGTPDWAGMTRLHGDGDIHAGNAQDGGVLVGGNGVGIPFPGSKGFRSFVNWSYQYGNLGVWESQDTVLLEEWAALGNEHNKNRRGVLAYGAVSDSTGIPTSGSATYSGIAYGWYAPNSGANPTVFRGTASATVNFATRQVTVTVQDALTYDAAGTPVPVNFTATTGMGTTSGNAANYMTGTLASGALSGGVSARYFGPVVSSGSSGTAPAEVGGAFSMSGAGGGAVAVGGFISRKQ
ncbi:MAG TPA: hypothetical protein VM571_04720 [Noviherbaspirillum sp.]|nr:hypothetical protein [Noviherbaspirillum sp.]